jgi:hypothetical protein
MNIKNNLFFMLIITVCFSTASYAQDDSEEQEASSSSWTRYLPGWGRATNKSSDFLGLAQATEIFGKSLEAAAKDIKLKADIKFQPLDLHDIKTISDNVVDTAFYLTQIRATAEIDRNTLRAIDRTMMQAENIAERIANPTIGISPQTAKQVGIIGIAATAFYFASSTLRSLAEKYIYKSAQANPTTDGAIAAASCAVLLGSACSIYYSGRLAGNRPKETPKRRWQQQQYARVFGLEDTQRNNMQMVLHRDQY